MTWTDCGGENDALTSASVDVHTSLASLTADTDWLSGVKKEVWAPLSVLGGCFFSALEDLKTGPRNTAHVFLKKFVITLCVRSVSK